MRDAADWPHREASSFVRAGGLRWHVQRMGQGPVLLLIHGTGASTHSWRELMPRLAAEHTVVAMDLPGHAFTEMPAAPQLSLPAMASLVAALVHRLALDVDWVIGHSAGAAIGARMLLDRQIAASGLAAINGAFLPLAGWPGLVFPPVARFMAATPLAARLFSQRSWDRAAVERLVGGTGSTLDARGLALYGKLVSDPAHVAGALGMMARWDLQPLARDLGRLRTPLACVIGSRDRAVPPRDAERVLRLLPAATPRSLATVPGGGHLVHEEQPDLVAACLRPHLAETAVQG